jgi:predicted RNA binding protein YcfA (HicA-like mRNA interferase family)
MKHVQPECLASMAKERGWRLVRINGSHYIYRNGGRTVVIPFHRGTMAPGTQRSIMRTLGITDDDL